MSTKACRRRSMVCHNMLRDIGDFSRNIVRDMIALTSVVDRETSSNGADVYVPMKVGEKFIYTDIPGSTTFYGAELLAIDKVNGTMCVKHLNHDVKYGDMTLQISAVVCRPCIYKHRA